MGLIMRLTKDELTSIREGDVVERTFCGLPTPLRVTRVMHGVIYCEFWTFDQSTGAEIDVDLEWGPLFGQTGSFLSRILERSDAQR